MIKLSITLIWCGIFLFAMSGCKETVVAPPPAAGENTLTVTAVTHDEFEQTVASTGAVSVMLVGVDRTVRATIAAGDSMCRFHGLPANSFLLSAQQNGYFPYETYAGAVWIDGLWSTTVHLYPHPSPLFRIDSISTQRLPNQLNIRFVTAQTAPASYSWRAAVFFSRSSSINPSTGAYEFTSQAYGRGNVLTDFHMISDYLVPSGTRLYVTARLMTPATQRFAMDSIWNHQLFTNCETNTTVVGSFIVE
jgi:hypothetical protein